MIETSTPSINEDLKIVEEVSKYSEVCLTGPHATYFAEELIQKPFISYILKGEYELPAYEMCRTMNKGIYNFMHISDDDFAKLPAPYRDAEHFPHYIDHILGPRTPQLPIAEARGCSFKCTFCVFPPVMYEREHRVFSNERILTELEDCIRRFPVNDIFFDSDTFGVCKSDKVIELSKEVHKFNIPWTVMSRADLHPLEVWLEMFRNGCYGFRFGIETFSPRLSKMLHKRENFDRVLEVIRGLRAVGARVHLCTMGGFPTETAEDRSIHEARLKEMSNLGVGIQKSWMVPFPGTPYYAELKSKGMDFIDDWDCYSGESSNIKCQQMVERIVREYK